MNDGPATARFDAALAALGERRWAFELFIAGATPASRRAVANLKALCEERLAGRYEITVIDLYEHPERAREAQIIAAPTLLRLLPEPIAQIVGDLSAADAVLAGLDLRPAS